MSYMDYEFDEDEELLLKELREKIDAEAEVAEVIVIKAPAPCIPVEIWKQIPEHAIQILEEAGYTKYDRKTDSIVFIDKDK